MSISALEAHRIFTEKDDLAMLNNPELWVHQPMLPVKRYVDGNTVCGVVCEGMTLVAEANLFLTLDGDLGAKQKIHRYESFEEIVKDGWIVD
jgi:hypothetical protein